jgi:hypothetical protein
MIAVEIGGALFEIHEGTWTGKPSSIARSLKKIESSLRSKQPGSYDPDPDLTSAEIITKALRGKIVSVKKHSLEDAGKRFKY